MKYQLTAPSWWDRLFCLLLHDHDRWHVDGTRYRRCRRFGCGMLVVIESPLARLRRKYRDQASAELRRGGRVL